MKNIFVSFHHELNQHHADNIRWNIRQLGYNDISVNEGTKIEDEDYKSDEQIRREIRDKYLKNVDVTIVIVGSDTTNRKHIDWEIRSTVYKYSQGKSGVILLVDAILHNSIVQNYWYLNETIEDHQFPYYPQRRIQNQKVTRCSKPIRNKQWLTFRNVYSHHISWLIFTAKSVLN